MNNLSLSFSEFVKNSSPVKLTPSTASESAPKRAPNKRKLFDGTRIPSDTPGLVRLYNGEYAIIGTHEVVLLYTSSKHGKYALASDPDVTPMYDGSPVYVLLSEVYNTTDGNMFRNVKALTFSQSHLRSINAEIAPSRPIRTIMVPKLHFPTQNEEYLKFEGGYHHKNCVCVAYSYYGAGDRVAEKTFATKDSVFTIGVGALAGKLVRLQTDFVSTIIHPGEDGKLNVSIAIRSWIESNSKYRDKYKIHPVSIQPFMSFVEAQKIQLNWPKSGIIYEALINTLKRTYFADKNIASLFGIRNCDVCGSDSRETKEIKMYNMNVCVNCADKSLIGYHGATRKPFSDKVTKREQRYTIGFEIEKEDNGVRNADWFMPRIIHHKFGWCVESDGSLGSGGFEAVSPIYPLFDEATLKAALRAEPVIHFVNAKYSDKCGGHINVADKERQGDQFFKEVFAGYAPLFHALYPKRAVNSYSQGQAIRNLAVKGSSKHRSINITGSDGSSRIEFRIFPSPGSVQTLLWRSKLLEIMIKNPIPIASDYTEMFNKLFELLLPEAGQTHELLDHLMIPYKTRDLYENKVRLVVQKAMELERISLEDKESYEAEEIKKGGDEIGFFVSKVWTAKEAAGPAPVEMPSFADYKDPDELKIAALDKDYLSLKK